MKCCVILLLCTVNFTLCIDEGFELLFATVEKEYQDEPVKVIGTLPTWLQGRLIRNGIGRISMGKRTFNHVFDGYSKLSSFYFNGSNTMLFSTKFLDTKFYTMSKKMNDVAPFVLFDSPKPAFNAFEKATQLVRGIDNTNVNVHAFSRKSADTKDFIAVSDFWQSYQFDPHTLETVSYVNAPLPTSYFLGDHVPLPSSSHPVKEFMKDSYISFVSYMSPFSFLPSYINVIRIKSPMVRENIVSIKCRKVSYMHGLGLSPNYAIIFADPLFINTWKILQDVKPLESLEWNPKENTYAHVVNIKTGHVTTLVTIPKVHMHFINAFEINGILFVDYIIYEDFNFIRDMKVDILLDAKKRNTMDPNSSIIRYRINLKRKTIKSRTFGKQKSKPFLDSFDFPSINENSMFKKYCFIYGTALKSDGANTAMTTLVKRDICRSRDNAFWFMEDHYPLEPIFLPTPGSTREDDGILLSLVLDGGNKTSYVGIYDAMNMTLIARAVLPEIVPFTIHGGFFPDSTIGNTSVTKY